VNFESFSASGGGASAPDPQSQTLHRGSTPGPVGDFVPETPCTASSFSTSSLRPWRINVSKTARNLGVIVDSQLTLSAQVAAVCCSGYYQLQQLRPLVRSMSSDAVKTLVQAFISCRLDYCNSNYSKCQGWRF